MANHHESNNQFDSFAIETFFCPLLSETRDRIYDFDLYIPSNSFIWCYFLRIKSISFVGPCFVCANMFRVWKLLFFRRRRKVSISFRHWHIGSEIRFHLPSSSEQHRRVHRRLSCIFHFLVVLLILPILLIILLLFLFRGSHCRFNRIQRTHFIVIRCSNCKQTTWKIKRAQMGHFSLAASICLFY